VTVVARTRAELATARDAMSGVVAVVMTMGALHEGHASLIRFARAHADGVIVTIFVNPLQFGANEDLDRYPRPLEADLEVCDREGADVVFTPTPDVVYPTDPVVRVSAGSLGTVFEGASRPGHFDGVVTVVMKLLHLTRPDTAYFGQKDAQQLAAIRRMVRDLDVPVDVIAVPTVREPDGLALSSRNVYLTPEQRESALVLNRSLRVAESMFAHDERSAGAIRDTVTSMISSEGLAQIDYVSVADCETLDELESIEHPALVSVAARFGGTRLIDNTILTPLP